MSAASGVERFWYQELKDPNEHKHGRCSECPLHWGHTGPCLIDFTSNKKPSRRAAIAAAASLKTIRPSFKNGTQVRHQSSDGTYYGKITKFNRKNATYTVHFCDGEVVGDMKAEELDVVPTEQPGVEDEEEEDVPQVIEASAVFPTIEEFMTKARLEKYTHDMKNDGWDDVQHLHETIKDRADFSDTFPIEKPGHRAKMLFALRKLVIE